MVLLKNDRNALPLDASKLRCIVVIGAHSDVGMISGGGSAQVDPIGGNAILPPGQAPSRWLDQVWFPTSPFKAIEARAPQAKVKYDAGVDPAAAAAAAKGADVVIVFAYQWEGEENDLPSLALPNYKMADKEVNQNAVIAAVAAVNPRTVVVLETGSPVTMPWVDAPAAILEAWYGGSDGANAIGNILFGAVNPSGKLPNTFPRSDRDLPHFNISVPPQPAVYDEGIKVGYKWYDDQKKPVLFPFGYGLSYTSYSYSGLSLTKDKTIKATFTLANTGARDGAEIAEVYAALPASTQEPPKRLVGFAKVSLKTGEAQAVTIEIDPRYLSIYDESKNAWTLVPGDYTIMVGGSSQDLPLKAVIHIE